MQRSTHTHTHMHTVLQHQCTDTGHVLYHHIFFPFIHQHLSGIYAPRHTTCYWDVSPHKLCLHCTSVMLTVSSTDTSTLFSLGVSEEKHFSSCSHSTSGSYLTRKQHETFRAENISALWVASPVVTPQEDKKPRGIDLYLELVTSP